jgi:predicted transposase/invertase (TIGR01784 family)
VRLIHRGKIINIEIQTGGNSDFINRSLYYWSRLYSSQLKESEQYDLLKPVISINLLEFILFPNLPIHNTYMLMDDETDEVLTDHCVMHYIEIPKLESSLRNGKFKDWLLYFVHEGKVNDDSRKEVNDLAEKSEEIHEAHKRYENFLSDDELRYQYEAHLKWKRDKYMMEQIARKEGLEKGMKEGLEQGIEQGIKQGIEQGIEQGLEQGIEQGLEKGKTLGEESASKKIALRMLEMEIEISKIAEVTGLEPVEIEKLSR